MTVQNINLKILDEVIVNLGIMNIIKLKKGVICFRG